MGTRFEDVTSPTLRSLHASHGALWIDIDADGDEDLALAGTRPDLLPLVWRNLLPVSTARQWLKVRVVDGRGRATRAGAEIRVYAPGTRTLISSRLVDTGSGYNSQNDLPVHAGVGSASRVDVEVVFPHRGRRQVVRAGGVETGRARPLTMTIPTEVVRPRQPDVIFVPTRESVADDMLTMAGVTSKDVVYDLGSGDGRILILAAQKFGATGVGIEIDPKLVDAARTIARDGEVEGRVTFVNGDLFEADISPATVVTIYLSPSVNARLESKLRQELRPGTRIVSHQFPIGQWPPDKTTRADDGTLLYLWTVPQR